MVSGGVVMAGHHGDRTTVPLPTDLAAGSDALIGVEGTGLDQTVTQSRAERLDRRSGAPGCEVRVARIIEEAGEPLGRLAGGVSGIPVWLAGTALLHLTEPAPDVTDDEPFASELQVSD
jgi:hypothetical protein